jgi:hypothetical protein
VSVGGDATSSVDQPVRDRSPVTDKPSTPPTMGGTAGEDVSYAPIPNNKKKKEAEEPLTKPLVQQRAAPTPAAPPAEPKKKHMLRAFPDPVAGLLTKPSALFEEHNDPLSPPLKQGEPSMLPTTLDCSGDRAQPLPTTQGALESAAAHFKQPADPQEGPWLAVPLATLEHPTAAQPTRPLLSLRASPAAKNTALPTSRATPPASAYNLWERTEMVGLARDLPHSQPSNLGSVMGSAVQLVQSTAEHAWQALVSGLASSQESSSVGREMPSEGMPAPQPSFPIPFAPLDQGSFALSGGSSMSNIGGVGPLLLGILALGGWYLLRRDSRTYLVPCELPKLSSALLVPLERPG